MRYMTIISAVLFALTLAGSAASAVFAMTAEEVLALKKAGVGDETIRMMIQQEKDGKRPATNHKMGKREIRDGDNVSIEYSTGHNMSSGAADAQQQQVDRAWEMLRHLIVDTRKTN